MLTISGEQLRAWRREQLRINPAGQLALSRGTGNACSTIAIAGWFMGGAHQQAGAFAVFGGPLSMARHGVAGGRNCFNSAPGN